MFAILGYFSFFFLEGVFYFLLGLAGYHQVQPFLAGLLFGTGDDLYLVAAAQLMPDWNQLMIHFGADAFAANRCVYTKGKIQGTGTYGQHFYITFRRVYINFFRQEGCFKIL